MKRPALDAAAQLERLGRQRESQETEFDDQERHSNAAECVLLQCDTLQSVLAFLSPKELAVCGPVCSTWRRVASSAALWQPHCLVRTHRGLRQNCYC